MRENYPMANKSFRRFLRPFSLAAKTGFPGFQDSSGALSAFGLAVNRRAVWSTLNVALFTLVLFGFNEAAAQCAAPTIATPSNITQAGATVNWIKVSGATYTLEVYADAAYTVPFGTFTSINDSKYAIEGATAGETYYYRVKVDNAGACTNYGTGSFLATNSYSPIEIASGYNHDVIANGVGYGASSTSGPVDGTNYAYYASGLQVVSGGTTYNAGVPANRVLTGSLSGLRFLMAPYDGNNSLRISVANASGTLVFTKPQRLSNLYIAEASGDGNSNVSIEIQFDDNTTQTATATYTNWDGASSTATPAIVTGMNRISRTTSATPESSTGFKIYQVTVPISSANQVKFITGVKITKTSAGTNTPVPNTFAISGQVIGTAPTIGTLTATASGPYAVNTSWTLNNAGDTYTASNVTYTLETFSNTAYTTAVGTPVTGITGNSYAVNGLNPNTQYYFRVRATNPAGNSGYATATATTAMLPCDTPSAPVSLALTPSATSVAGAITAPTTAPVGYLVVRSTAATLTAGPVNNTNYTSGGSLGGGTIVSVGTATTFNNTGLTSATSYNYFVYSYNSGSTCVGPVYSTTSVTANAKTCLAAPLIVGASNVRNSSANLNWTKVTGDGVNPVTYTLEVATVADFSTLFASYTGLTTARQTISGLTANTIYYWRVTALESGLCNSAAVTSNFKAENTYTPIDVNGYTTDVIANGTGPASASTTGAIDAVSNAYLARDYKLTATSSALSYGLPLNRNLTGSITGLKFFLEDYAQNNSIRIAAQNASATINLTVPLKLTDMYIAVTGGSGTATVKANINFEDNTTQEVTGLTFQDWYQTNTATPSLITDLGRVSLSSGNPETGNSKIFQVTIPITAANQSKKVTGVTFTKTSGGTTEPVAQIFAISGKVIGDCPTMTSMAATAPSSTSALLSWTLGTPGDGYQASDVSYTVEIYSDANFTTAVGTPVTGVTGTTYTVNALTPNTMYYFRVKGINTSCESGYVSASIATPCNTTALPYNQGFNTTSTPACWTQQYVSGTSNITFVASSSYPATTPQEGADYAFWNSYTITSGNSTRLVSAPLSTTGIASVNVEFYFMHDSGYSTKTEEGVQVQYSLDGANWTDVGGLIQRYNATLTGWNKKTITLPSAVGNQSQVYVGFKFVSQYGNNCSLDNVLIRETPAACSTPDAATAAVSNTTNNAATLTVTAPATAPVGYLIVRSTSATLSAAPANNTTYAVGNTLGGGTVISYGNTTVINENALEPATTYYYFVYSYNSGTDCTGPVYSLTSGNATASTCVTPPVAAATSDISSSKATINWSAVAGATYALEIYTDAGFTTSFATYSAQTVTSKVITGLTNGATYYFRIKVDNTSICSLYSTGSFTAQDAYTPLSVTGFTQDVIANGTGPASASSGAPVDSSTSSGANFAYLATDYKLNATASATGYGLPLNRTLTSSETSGLSFLMSDYAVNNSLRLEGVNSNGTLTLATPVRLTNLYVAATSGNGNSTFSAQVFFTDGTSQTATALVATNWDSPAATGNSIIVNNLGRVSRGTGAAASGAFKVFQANVAIDAANQNKLITGIKFTNTSATASGTAFLLNIFAVSGKVATGPCYGWTGLADSNWNNTANWCAGVVPTSTDDVTIDASAHNPVVNVAVAVNSISISTGATLTVNTGTTLTVNNAVTVAPNGYLIVQDNAALLQVNEAVNTGAIVQHKNSNSLYRLDYTLWSSPVTGTQTLHDFSPNTLSNRYYEYMYATNSNSVSLEAYWAVDATTTTWEPAKGFLIRMPNHSETPNFNEGTAAIPFDAVFNGTPNNGTITKALSTDANRFTAAGNPYPSPINVASFFAANSSVLENGSGIWLWRKRNNATSSSYATLTTSAFVANPATGGGAEQATFYAQGNEANWLIAQGQGFFVKTAAGLTNPQVTFNNAMRRAMPGSSQAFFKSAASNDEVVKSRIWLNMFAAEGSASQTAIAYQADATLGLDYAKDGKTFAASNELSFYSVSQSEKLAVQARPAFEVTDVVPMGFNTPAAGEFTISIDHVDGLFENGQTVYLRDNQEGIVRNLSQYDYNFTSEAGTFENRFEVFYQNGTALGTDAPVLDANSVIVYKQDKTVNINSGNTLMNGVKVFDIRGRLLFSQSGINAATFSINSLEIQQQVIILEIATEKGTVSKRIVY